MKRLVPLLLLPVLAWAEDQYALDGGTRTFVGSDVVNTFTESGTLVVREETTVRALFVAGGGGDVTGYGTNLPGGDGARRLRRLRRRHRRLRCPARRDDDPREIGLASEP